jgi:hypothetical protein
MSDSFTRGKLAARLFLYVFVAFLALVFFHSYRVVRTERVSTRLALRLAEGQHEVVASLPSGRFQIQFTPKPNVSPAVVVPPVPVLPAHIATSVLREDGTAVVQPTDKEYVTFSVADADAFRPLRFQFTILKTNECTVYVNLASGF